MNNPYYTLVGFNRHSLKWEILFGDYERECVRDEQDEYAHDSDYAATKIIKSVVDQEMINIKVAALAPLTAECIRQAA